jgi:nitrous oxidase accessory protein NosD
MVKNCSFSSLPDAEGQINSRLTGLYAYGSGSVKIEGCDFVRSGTGVYITNDTKYEIKDSVFTENRIAISLGGTVDGRISDNRITGSLENGLLINSVGVTEVTNNMFYKNAIHGLDLYLSMCTDCGCGGKVFNGTVNGYGNIFDSTEGICPQNHPWPENFYVVDELLGITGT